MLSVHPYLTFKGNCEEAFNHYKKVFGGDFTYIGRFREMPPQEGQPPMPEEAGNLIMHVSLPIGEHTILMGSDTMDEYCQGEGFVQGNNAAMSINADSREQADRIFNGLSEGGKVTMPMTNTFWGAYFGMFTDRFGVHWMVNFDEKPMK